MSKLIRSEPGTDILAKYSIPPKYNPGDLIESSIAASPRSNLLGKTSRTYVVIANDRSRNKYTILQLPEMTMTYEGRNFIELNFNKLGVVDLEIIKLLYT